MEHLVIDSADAILDERMVAMSSLSTEQIPSVFMRVFDVFKQRSVHSAFLWCFLVDSPAIFLILIVFDLVLALSVISSHCFVHFCWKGKKN